MGPRPNQSAATATFVFKTFAWARIAHTVIYCLGIPQPGRILSFTVGVICNTFMAKELYSAFG